LEQLESRDLLAILTVNSIADNVSGITTTLSLREAVLLVDTGGMATDTSGNSLNSLAKASQISGSFGSDDTIQFDPSLFGGTQQTITLGGSELLLSQSVTIAGPGSGSLAVSGNGQSGVFDIENGATVNLFDLTITGGSGTRGVDF
jgi:hypothetical protein